MKTEARSIIIALILTMLSAASALSQGEMQFPVQEFRLENGMTFLVVERHTAPVFSGFISVAVGSAYEKTGSIGSAHLLEHMMFKGSQSIGTTDFEAERDIMAKEDSVWTRIEKAVRKTRYIKLNEPEKLEAHLKYIDDLHAILDSLAQAGSQYIVQNEFERIYTRHGATYFNARTGYDFTSYMVSLPANRLELWFAMESDRLKQPAFREFFKERNIVSEERRESVENVPEAKVFEQLIGTAFMAHPYYLFWEWQSEVNSLTRNDIQEFFDTYYISRRIVISVIGDVRLDEVKNLAEKYFGPIPAGEDPEPIYTVETKQPGERRLEVIYDATPMISIAYHKTAFDAPEEPAFSVIERLLGQGRTSRLYKALVLNKQLCSRVDVYTFPGSELGDIYPGVFCIDAYPKEGVSTEEVEAAIYEELERLAATPADENELLKIKNNIDAQFVWAAYRNLGLARYLATAQNLAKDWRYLIRFRDKLKAVTAEDVMNTAGKYFTTENRTVATLIPKKGDEQ
ncbi:MAG: insulinase family protein [Candidatus Zixiibacteriota bacterium]|nr:MAG: insulinase family protein [candidate division Zixibacteria bacterium]